MTSSSSVPSSSLRSRSVVVGADQTRARSPPRAPIAARSAAVKVLGRRRSRLASSASAAASAASLASQSRSRPRATRRLSGSTARYRRSALVAW